MPKHCSTCKLTKEAGEFHRNKAIKDGLATSCKHCCSVRVKAWRAANPEKAKENARRDFQNNKARRYAIQQKWNDRNKDRMSAWYREWRMNRMGLTVTEYEEKLIQQGGVCGICLMPNKNQRPLHVDHDHKCHPVGKHACKQCIRGLLCNECNTSLHKMESMDGWEIAARSYLNRFKKG